MDIYFLIGGPFLPKKKGRDTALPQAGEDKSAPTYKKDIHGQYPVRMSFSFYCTIIFFFHLPMANTMIEITMPSTQEIAREPNRARG